MKSDTHKKNEWQLQVIGIEFKVAWYVEREVAIENFVGKTKKLLHRRRSTVCSHKQSQLLCVFIRPILPKVELLYEVLRQLSNNALTLSPSALLELQHSPDFPRRLTFFFFFIVLSQFSPKVKIHLYFSRFISCYHNPLLQQYSYTKWLFPGENVMWKRAACTSSSGKKNSFFWGGR